MQPRGYVQMPAEQHEVDDSSIFDNLDGGRLEFDGEVDGEEYPFAVQ